MLIRKILALVLALCLTHASSAWASSYTFNATTSKIAIPANAALDTASFTAGCWTYRAGAGEGSLGAVITKANAPTFNNGWDLFNSDAAGTYEIVAYVIGADGKWRFPRQALNTWGHVVLAYNTSATTNDPVAWLDGVSQTVSQISANPDAVLTNNEQLHIGNYSSNDFTWDGRIADCFEYNRVLSTNEVKQIMRCGPQSLKNGLVGYWPLGVFGGNNYTSTASINGTVTDGTVSTGPPRFSAQGGFCQ